MNFPPGCLRGRFARLDPAARQLPRKAVGPVDTLTEQDELSLRHDYRDATCHYRIFRLDRSAPRCRQRFELYGILPVYRGAILRIA